MSTEEALTKVEKQLNCLKDELDVCKEAKKLSEACHDIHEFSEKEEEPFSISHKEPITWHENSGGGGGCSIL